MVTLTYPGDWEVIAPDGASVKRHMVLWRKRFQREYGEPARYRRNISTCHGLSRIGLPAPLPFGTIRYLLTLLANRSAPRLDDRNGNTDRSAAGFGPAAMKDSYSWMISRCTWISATETTCRVPSR